MLYYSLLCSISNNAIKSTGLAVLAKGFQNSKSLTEIVYVGNGYIAIYNNTNITIHYSPV